LKILFPIITIIGRGPIGTKRPQMPLKIGCVILA